MLRPERSDKNGLLGYLIQAHCWVLLDRVIGHKLVEQKLKIFVNAVKQFWKENSVLWRHDKFDHNYDDSFYPAQNRLRESSQITETAQSEKDQTRYVDMSKNPAIVPEIQTLISQAALGHSESENNDTVRSQQTTALDVSAERAMMVVNNVYNDIYYRQASIDDLRNMLIAFQWKLPDSYWQSRCMKDLIFEVDDLIRSSNQRIDWQFLCLNIEELFLRDGWYDSGGLKNRGRTLQLLQGLKRIFLAMIKQQDDDA